MKQRHYQRAKKGVTATSYGLVVGLIAVVALVTVDQVGDSVTTLFGTTSDSLAVVAAAEPVATPEPTPDMLTPGDTAKTVTRDGFEVRCLNWNGNTCRVPQIRIEQATGWLAGATEYGTNTPLDIWRELSYQTSGHEQRNGELFCYWATGDHTLSSVQILTPSTFGYTAAPDAVFAWTFCSVFSNVRPCYEGDYTNPSSGETWELAAVTFNYTPTWVVATNCAAWQ